MTTSPQPVLDILLRGAEDADLELWLEYTSTTQFGPTQLHSLNAVWVQLYYLREGEMFYITERFSVPRTTLSMFDPFRERISGHIILDGCPASLLENLFEMTPVPLLAIGEVEEPPSRHSA